MDLNTISSYRHAHTRDDLALAPGERIVAGGTWFFSEPQVDATGVVDITGMGWSDVEDLPDGGLRVAATCPVATLASLPERPEWRAQPLFFQCATALLASFKIWNVATVGGNICRSFAAASMVSLAVALDAEALIWPPTGGERRVPVAELVTGNGTNTLGPAEVLRAIDFPGYALRARTGMRKIALAELGRSGAVVTGRVDEDGTAVFGITAATGWPTVLRYPTLPDAEVLRADIDSAPGYYTDPLGSADWRRAVSAVLADEIRAELAADPGRGW
ncbi:putative molybdopterin dehydrogenase, FAD-binding subunit [Gordonia polyisoprenivorans VH2]|uniref:Putative molybdopterin dehydrogenase, FAD-binding subunit n=1 Tax=Gordonia polyisoprenivorans (strain DSM 44266 / VH2) TaxID=1112204 RepID=H6MUF1_GORPV|nr:FAD binding domain-containing protein [Gordonia polyisoprenivorans]AFA72747.1 putative molybdopterin dehydrogenase, FAD-binding subunit [Gordonia polyisoprenivorans VH2]